MALKHAILAALREEEASGYELSKRFDVSVANFWPATPQQIYRELDRLEDDGLLAARLVEQSRRPNKRIFSLTADGRQELGRFIETPSRPTAIRDDLLVKVVALDDENAEAVAAAIRERLEQSEAKLGLYRRIRSAMLGDLDEAGYLRSTERVGDYLALMRGISFEEDNQAWCRSSLKVIAGRRTGVPG
ncbi:MAG: PadR family transcriptional regulator [Thermoleophilia bacterium]|nr:PadR family transcriptional regulator [Thermoleophilia bacterium]